MTAGEYVAAVNACLAEIGYGPPLWDLDPAEAGDPFGDVFPLAYPVEDSSEAYVQALSKALNLVWKVGGFCDRT